MIKTTYEEELNRKGSFTYTCSGISMLPLLRQRKDLFTIEKKQGRCEKYDVVLYKRYPESYVLHRVVEVREKDYVILGDNCLNKEYGIRDEDIIGVMTSFVRNGKEYSVSHRGYRVYAVVWFKLYPLRRLWMKCKIKCRGILKKGK
ncbi:MAG: S26 family signal peptidase [Lachnospiraceae bacterium]|nr:S26 family signal peptidase [Lachnospiraceae bacterium]